MLRNATPPAVRDGSAEQGQDRLRDLVRLRQHRGTGLREDLRPGEGHHLLRHVGVADPGLGSGRFSTATETLRIVDSIRFWNAPSVARFSDTPLIAIESGARASVCPIECVAPEACRVDQASTFAPSGARCSSAVAPTSTLRQPRVDPDLDGLPAFAPTWKVSVRDRSHHRPPVSPSRIFLVPNWVWSAMRSSSAELVISSWLALSAACVVGAQVAGLHGQVTHALQDRVDLGLRTLRGLHQGDGVLGVAGGDLQATDLARRFSS
jgi:hypothetical protein